ncbi:hypothetical protein F4778DRAFT_588298 [Xylariomycetidae sp. FL2044]|nr:hypothetical protein F4778DRAFT_588298 [Xylariomycetidae sp. FL2044]
MVKKKPSSSHKPAKTAKPAPAQRQQRQQQQHHHQQSSSSSSSSSARDPVSPGELKHQQTLLDIFSTTFSAVLQEDTYGALLQEVKQALYAREFGRAFGREDYLEVYAARWSPTRALCYRRVLAGIGDHLLMRDNDDDDDHHCHRGEDEKEEAMVEGAATQISQRPRSTRTQETKKKKLRILAIGGGAAETVAFASYLSAAQQQESQTASSHNNNNNNDDDHTTTLSATIQLLDTGPWQTVVSKLHATLTTAPALSKYASPAAQASNRALISSSDTFQTTFLHRDVLSLEAAELAGLFGMKNRKHDDNSDEEEEEKKKKEEEEETVVQLVTLLFTLNELYTSGGVGRTTGFLRRLTQAAPGGTLLLVVDSPGTYSEAVVGKAARRYPMQWLLDHTLLGGGMGGEKAGEEEEEERGSPRGDTGGVGGGGGSGGDGCRWEKLESHDSVWFRLADGLRYPIELENMRYQMHLYRASRPQDKEKEVH